MKSYLLFTLISFVSADVYERFLYVEDGPKTITCSDNSFIVTDTKRYEDLCNKQQSCKIENHNVTYVCIKNSSNYCSHLECHFQNVSVDVTSDLLQVYLVELGNLSVKLGNLHGIKNGQSRIQFKFCADSQVRQKDSRVRQERFEKSKCERLTHDVTPKEQCVFNSANRTLELNTKAIHEKCIHIFVLEKSFSFMHDKDMETYSAFYYKKTCEKSFRMNVGTNGWILFKASNSSREDFSEVFSERYRKEADTSLKTGKGSRGSAKFYVFIILGIIIFILLVILLVVAYFFYRKMHPGREHSKGISPSDFNYFPSGHQSSISVDNIVYQSGEKAGPETLARSSQLNHGAQNSAEMIYSTIEEEEVGGPVTAEDPSFVVVHGDVYAVVNKGDPSHEKPSNIADDLRREEVNGQLYTFVSK